MLQAAADISINGALNFTGVNGSLTVNPAGFTVTFNLPAYYPGYTTIGGAGGLVVNGSGTVVLNYATSYEGSTVVSNGALRLNAAHSGNGEFIVHGGTLQMNGVDSGTGGIAVMTNGTMTVASTGRIASSTNVVVNGGVLELQTTGDVAIGDSIDVSISGGGRMILGSGVADTVGTLYLGGGKMLNGAWGSQSSPAEFKTDRYFSGAGILIVTNGIPKGLLLIVR